MPEQLEDESPEKDDYQILHPTGKTIKNHVHVSVRLKPILQDETARETRNRNRILRVQNDQQLRQVVTRELFTFDRIYGDELTTKELYEDEY